MSVQITPEIVDFDPAVAHWVEQYRQAKNEISKLTEQADIARSHIEAALGQAEIGTVQGNPVVRWKSVQSTRLDVKKAREILPEQVLDILMVKSDSRRFILVDPDEVY
jgi:predicted phage-related endonuclease